MAGAVQYSLFTFDFICTIIIRTEIIFTKMFPVKKLLMKLSVPHIYPALVFIFLLFTDNSLAAKPPSPDFKDPMPALNNTGYLTLDWTDMDGNLDYEVEEKGEVKSTKERIIYRGKGDKLFLSGLKNGEYRYRVRAVNSDGSAGKWSHQLTLRVKHHSMNRALFLFALGFFIFAATCYVIAKESRKEGKTHP